VNPADPDEFNVYHDPSWRPLLQLAEQRSDLIRMRSAVRSRSWDPGRASVGPQTQKSAFGAPVPARQKSRAGTHDLRANLVQAHRYVENQWHCARTTIRIGGRTLSSTTRREPSVDTIWTTEHLLKNTDDLKAYLELPEEFFAEEIDVAKLIADDGTVGERGIVMVDTEDPICAAASLFRMEDFLTIALTEPTLFHQLAYHCLGAKEGAFQVDVEHLIPLSFSHVQEVDPWEDAGIIHQDVDTSEDVPRLDHGADVTHPCDAARYSHCAPSCFMDLLHDGLTSCLIVQVIHHHVRALTSKGEGDRFTDALLRTRHQRHLPC